MFFMIADICSGFCQPPGNLKSHQFAQVQLMLRMILFRGCQFSPTMPSFATLACLTFPIKPRCYCCQKLSGLHLFPLLSPGFLSAGNRGVSFITQVSCSNMGSSVDSVVWRVSSSLLQQFCELGDGHLPSSIKTFKTFKRQDLIFVIYLGRFAKKIVPFSRVLTLRPPTPPPASPLVLKLS